MIVFGDNLNMATALKTEDTGEDSKNTQSKKKMPPTAKGLKDGDYGYKGLTKLKEKYGPIFSLPVGSV